MFLPDKWFSLTLGHNLNPNMLNSIALPIVLVLAKLMVRYSTDLYTLIPSWCCSRWIVIWKSSHELYVFILYCLQVQGSRT